MTVTQVKNTLIVAALVCAAVAVHDVVRHLAYGGQASAWRPTRPLPPVAPVPADQTQR